jgi:hypothetical protein
MRIEGIELLEKAGGRSGRWTRAGAVTGGGRARRR